MRRGADHPHLVGYIGICPQASALTHPEIPLPANVQSETRLKNRLQWQRQIMRDPALKARASRLHMSVTYGLN